MKGVISDKSLDPHIEKTSEQRKLILPRDFTLKSNMISKFIKRCWFYNRQW